MLNYKDVRKQTKHHDTDVFENILQEVSHLKAIHETILGAVFLPLSLPNKIHTLKEALQKIILAHIKNVLHCIMCQNI